MICSRCHSDLRTRERCEKLERLSRDLGNIDCKNSRSKNCPFSGSVDEVKNHELNCYYDDPEFACLLQDQCQWVGRSGAFISHLMDAHEVEQATAVSDGQLGIELFTSAADVREWKQHSWNALYQREVESLQRVYWLSAVCTDHTLHISIFSLGSVAEPVKVCVKSSDGQMLLFLGMTQLPSDPSQPHFTISLAQLSSFSQPCSKQVAAEGPPQSTSSVTVSVFFASHTFYSIANL